MDGESLLMLSLLGGAVYALTEALKLALKGLPETSLWQRLLPLYPLVLGALGAILIPGFAPGETAAERSVYGILTGAFSGQAYELVKRQLARKLPAVEGGNGGSGS